MVQKLYGVEFIFTGCVLCREKGFPQQGHVYCITTALDSEFPETILIGSAWHGFRTDADLRKFVELDSKELTNG